MKKDIKIITGLLIVWAPLAYVLYGSGTGEPPLNGWIVSVIVFFSYFFVSTIVSDTTFRSKITYAIFDVINIVVLIILCVTYFGIGGYIPSTLNNLQWFFGFATLVYLYFFTWECTGNRKKLAYIQYIEKASWRGTFVKNTKILVMLLFAWTPLAYVLYGSYTGEPPYNGWVVSIIVLFSYVFATVPISGMMEKTSDVLAKIKLEYKPSVAPTSKITYAIFHVTLIAASIALCVIYFGIGGYIPSTLNILQWFFGLATLVFLYFYCVVAVITGKTDAPLYSRSQMKLNRKKLAQDTKKAKLLGTPAEALRKKHEKDARD